MKTQKLEKYILSAIGATLWACLIYGGTFHSSFHFDDTGFVVNSPAIRELGNIPAIWKALETPTRFIPFLTFALNYKLNGLDVFGYHLVNFIIHLLNAALVFFLSKSILFIPSVKEKIAARYADTVAFFSSAVFLVHPVQTQAVTYISQRFEIMAALFYLSTVCCYIQGRLKQGRPGAVKYFSAAILFAVLGVFTKEIVITLPLMIYMVEKILFGGNSQEKQSSRLPLRFQFLVIAVILVIPLFFSYRLTSIFFHPLPSESHDGDVITFWPFVLTQMRVGITFLKLLAFPVGQNLDYDYPLSQSLWEWPVLLSSAVHIFLIGAAFKLRKTQKVYSLGIFWFYIIFAANLVPRHNLLFEHKLYLMGVGPIIAGVSLGIAALKDLRQAIKVFAVLCIILSACTFQRNKVWRSELTLWQDVVKKSPQKSRPNLNLGRAYNDIGDHEKALFYYNKAISLDPQNRKAYNNRGLLYFRAGKIDHALADLNRAIELESNYYEALLNRANLYVSTGRDDLAMADYDFILIANPDYGMAYVNRGSLLAKHKKFDQAIEDLNKAEQLFVQSTVLYNNRANAYRFLGKFASAMVDFDRAISLDPNYALTYRFRSETYLQMGRYEDAWKDAIQAKKLGARMDSNYLKVLEQSIKKSLP